MQRAIVFLIAGAAVLLMTAWLLRGEAADLATTSDRRLILTEDPVDRTAAAALVVASIDAMPAVRDEVVVPRGPGPDVVEVESPLRKASPSSVASAEFSYWRILAKKAGRELPNDFELPHELHALFANEYLQYAKVLKDVDAVRVPIVDRLSEVKKANRQWETFPGPDTIKDPQQAKANRAAIAAARRETRENQTVIRGGFGGTSFIIRVDETEDPGLPPLYARIAAARRQYVDNVYFGLAPHLR